MVGLPDPRLGEVPAAALVGTARATIEPCEVLTWVRGELAAHMIPAVAVVVDALPRNAMMKVLPNDVRRLITAEQDRTRR